MATKYPRSFIYKVYKILCKMFDVEAICFGKLYKKAKTECIYAIDSSGQKFPFICKIVKNRYANLIIRKNAKKSDIQKEIVLRILKALETEDVCMYRGPNVDMPCVEKGTCFEEKVIEYDLKCRLPMKHDSLRKMEQKDMEKLTKDNCMAYARACWAFKRRYQMASLKIELNYLDEYVYRYAKAIEDSRKFSRFYDKRGAEVRANMSKVFETMGILHSLDLDLPKDCEQNFEETAIFYTLLETAENGIIMIMSFDKDEPKFVDNMVIVLEKNATPESVCIKCDLDNIKQIWHEYSRHHTIRGP